MTIKSLRFILLHLLALGSVSFGITWTAFALFVFFYYFRLLAVAICYHRYFSHRCFQTNRIGQFILGLWGACSGQRGPLWWAALHRHHHRFSDTSQDIHSPKWQSLWESHVGWVLKEESRKTKNEYVKDLRQYPELLWLEKHASKIFILSLLLLIPLTLGLQSLGFQLSLAQGLAWGGLLSFILSSHVTLTVNSLFHFGKKQNPESNDYAINVAWATPFMLGENFHLNHHRQPAKATNIIETTDLDPIYFFLKIVEKIGLIWDVRH